MNNELNNKYIFKNIASLFFLIAATTIFTGCAELLPKQSSQIASPWKSYEEAQASIVTIVPHKSTLSDLRNRGFDPFITPNVQLLTYSDITLRFPMSASLPIEKMDPGLRSCFEAGNKCQGYSINIKETHHDRDGNFWLDSLQFYRSVSVTGWSFNALVLLVDQKVVFVIYGGQPVIKERETNKQPLGPLQGWGDALPGFLK